MRKIQLAKSRVTDYRPTAAKTPPLERTARPVAVAWPDNTAANAEKAKHDLWVKNLSDTALLAAAIHIGSPTGYSRDPEAIWKRNRLAALAREIDRRGLNKLSAV